MRIYTEFSEPMKSERLYESFLKGTLPREGCILTEGPRVYFLRETPAPNIPDRASSAPSAETAILDSGREVPLVSFPDTAGKAEAAWKSYREGRHLPAGCALAVSSDCILVFPAAAWTPDLGSMDMFRLSFDPLEEVLTPTEAAARFGLDVKRIQADCENAGTGIFTFRDVRKSDKTWLISKRAADRIYGHHPEEHTGIDPLILVFTTTEAAKIWNRDSGTVRNAAGGAGHMSARMGEGERRKSGRIWLVTRDAMERLFGQFLPNEMKAALRRR